MAKKILMRRGMKADLPVLDFGEIGLCQDTKELFIGTPLGNMAINDHVTVEIGTANGNILLNGEEVQVYDDSTIQSEIANKASIDDNNQSSGLTWSSNKIHSMILNMIPDTNLYIMELDRWGIIDSANNSIDTSNGINNALEWAHRNGYTNFVFPKGEYLINEDIPLKFKSRSIYNLNGSKFKIRENGKEKYAIIKLDSTEFTIIRNGILEGDRYTHDYFEGAMEWSPSTEYNVGDKVIPIGHIGGSTNTGIGRYRFECTTAGTSGETEPTWEQEPIIEGNTVTDGTVIWTAVDSGTHEWGVGVEFCGRCRFSVVEGCEIFNFTGDGVQTSGAYNQKGVIYKTDIEEGSINTSTGEMEISTEWVRTNKSYNLNDPDIQTNGYIGLYGNGYGRWNFDVRHYNAYFYDEQGDFITAEANQIWNTPVYFPKNAAHVYFAVNQPMPDLQTIEDDRFAEFRTQSNVEFATVRNTEIHHTRRTGMALGYGRHIYIQNNEIHHVSGAAPECAIDVEDGNWTNQHYHFEGNTCHHNGLYDLILFSGVYVTVTNNEFHKTCTTNNMVQHTIWKNNKFRHGSRLLLSGEAIMDSNYFYGSYLQVQGSKEKLISKTIFENSFLTLDLDVPYTATVSKCYFKTDNNAKLLGISYKLRLLGAAAIVRDCKFSGTDETISPTYVSGTAGENYLFERVMFYKTKGITLPSGEYTQCKFVELDGNISKGGTKGDFIFKDCDLIGLNVSGGLNINNARNLKLSRNEITISGTSRFALRIQNIDEGIIENNTFNGNNLDYYSVSSLVDVPSTYAGNKLFLTRNIFNTNHEAMIGIKTRDSKSPNPIVFKDNDMSDCTIELKDTDLEINTYYYGIVPDTTPPNDITGLTATTTPTSAHLSWTESTSTDVTGYEIYNGAQLVGSVDASSFDVTDLTELTQYTFTVKAKDGAGNTSTGKSITVTTGSSGDITPPDNVTNLQANNPTETTVDLSWTAATANDIAAYRVYNGEELIDSTTEISFRVTGLTASTEYTLTVKSVDSSGNESNGTNVIFTTSEPDTTSPDDITNLSVSVTDTTATLTWTPSISVDVENYEVSYSPDNGSTWTTEPLLNSNTTEYTIIGLTESTEYLFRVVAIDFSSNRSSGSTVAATTNAGDMVPPSDPTGLRINIGASSSTSFWIFWDKIEDDPTLAGYELIDESDGSIIKTTNNPAEYRFYVGDRTPATGYTLTLKAYDEAGNRSEGQTIYYVTHEEAPSITGLSVTDSFDRYDNALEIQSLGFSDTGHQWSPSQFRIADGGIVSSNYGAANEVVSLVDTTISDNYKISVELTNDGLGFNKGIVVKHLDASNYIRFEARFNDLRLIVNGVTVQTVQNVPEITSVSATLSAEVEGQLIKCFVNGEFLFAYNTDIALLGTLQGLSSHTSNTATLDNFSIVSHTPTGSIDTVPPSDLTGVTANAVDATTIDLSWDAHPNTDGDLSKFIIYDDTGNLITSVGNMSNSASLIGTTIAYDSTATITIKSIDKYGNESNGVSITPS